MTSFQTSKPAVSGTETHDSARPKWRILVELAVGYLLIMGVIWTPKSTQRWLFGVAIAWILIASIVSFPGRKAIGIHIEGLGRSLWVAGVALVLAACAFWLADEMHTLHVPHGFQMWVRTFLGYAIWSFVQQLLLQGFFLLRLLQLMPSKTSAAITAAGIFSLAHLPNPILTPMTLVWGLCACLIFLKTRNIFSLGLAHAVFGICIAVTMPAPTIRNMRVGLGYLTYHHPAPAYLSQSDQTVSTVAWVMAAAPTLRSLRHDLP